MEKLYIQTIKDTGEELKHYIDQDGERLSIFGPISRVNILIGATNSGKSRFMRGLVKSPSYVGFPLGPSIAHPSSVLNVCTRLSNKDFHILIKANPESREHDPEALAKEFPWMAQYLRPTKKGEIPELHLTGRNFSSIKELLRQELMDPISGSKAQQRRGQLNDLAQKYQFALQTSGPSTADREWFSLRKDRLTEDVIEDIKTVLEFVEASPSPRARNITPLKIVYIPVLRTAVALKEANTSNTADYLAQSVSVNYGLDSSDGKVEVFTGNLLYWTIQEERSGDIQNLKRLGEFERFLGKTFFEGVSIELVPLSEKDGAGRHLALSFIDQEVQRRFHDIGDGIQAIIILMYRLFTAESRTWIFIEEPEQGLHPGLQRIFLETLTQHPVLQEKDLRIFLSTHSNHMLGMALSELEEDVSVFAFQRWTNPERFQIRPIHNRQQNLLTLLGVTNSSVFLANCGIWVEGITDRKYLRAYLSAYLQSDKFKTEYNFVPQEDIHYAFFEYAGSNLVHYLFESEDGASSDHAEQIRARFLCNRIFLLADQDKNKEEKHARLKACQSESFRYYVTPGIEVENLISKDDLSQALPQLISKLTEEDVAKANIQFSDYCKKRIGSYLKETFDDLCPDALKADSGTLSAYYKDKLASLVCPNVTWESMSEDARNLAKTLYGFIYTHNQVASKRGS